VNGNQKLPHPDIAERFHGLFDYRTSIVLDAENAVTGNSADFCGGDVMFAREVENNRKALEMYRDLNRADPKNALLRQGLAIAYVNAATALSGVGNIAESLDDSNKGLELMRSLVAATPQNSAQRSIFAAMLAARQERAGFDVWDEGNAAGPPLAVLVRLPRWARVLPVADLLAHPLGYSARAALM
jgi:hypothetical protein